MLTICEARRIAEDLCYGDIDELRELCAVLNETFPHLEWDAWYDGYRVPQSDGNVEWEEWTVVAVWTRHGV